MQVDTVIKSKNNSIILSNEIKPQESKKVSESKETKTITTNTTI